MLFSKFQWLMVISTLIFCFLMAAIRAILRKMAAPVCRGMTRRKRIFSTGTATSTMKWCSQAKIGREVVSSKPVNTPTKQKISR